MIDLAILGGGPASASAALTLKDSGLSIALIVPPPSSGPRIGESLSPAANPILKELGIWQAFVEEEHRPSEVTFSAWGSGRLIEKRAGIHPGGPGWSLDRDRFESFLWRQSASMKALRRSAALKEFRRVDDSLEPQSPEPYWELTLRDGETLRARFLLDGSGRAAVVSRRLATRTRYSRLLAAYTFLPQIDLEITPTAAILVETTADGWWYSSLVPQGQMVVVFFFDPELFEVDRCRDPGQWEDLLRSAPYTWKRVTTAGFAVRGLPDLTDAGSQSLDRYVGEGWAAVGDAAAALDPLSSHGLTLALWSGRRAALGVAAALSGDPELLREYEASFIAGIARYREELRQIYAQERRFPDAAFWQRRRQHPG